MSSVHADEKLQSEDLAVAASSEGAPSADTLAEHDTDIVYGELMFTRPGTKELCWMGFPTCSTRFFSQMYHFGKLAMSVEKHEVAILDARRRSLDYEKCGFTLRPLESKVTNWQEVTISGSAQRNLFTDEMETIIRQLHPDVKKITFEGNLLRGGAGANPPATNGLHLDLYPDLEQVKKVQQGGQDEIAEEEFEGLEMKIVLGLWMPREMANPVYDYPLLVGDASTFEPEDIVPQRQDFYHIAEGEKQRVRNLAASAPIFSPRQRWYYYSQQTCNEVIIFRHLTEPAGGKACFHAAFQQPLPEGMETRRSIETRAFLHFSKA
jgi:hypothetical protein